MGRVLHKAARSVVAACVGATLTGCAPPDLPNTPVRLEAPYRELPDPSPSAAIEPGMPVKLDQAQIGAVVDGVLKWMKNPPSVSFGTLGGAKNARGVVTVCGEVSGRNSAGNMVAKSPFIGALMGEPRSPEFVVVEIGSTPRQRAVVDALCQQSGIFR